MKSDKKPLIIEFLGLPGCGKSTVSAELCRHLTSLGYHVKLYESMLTDFQRPSLFRKLLILCSYSSIKAFYIFQHLRCYGKNLREFKLEEFWNFTLIFYHYRRLTGSRSDTEIYIVSQGFLQALLSYVFLDKITNVTAIDKVLLMFCKCFPMVRSVVCHIPKNDDFHRIRQRGSNQGRLDRMPDDELLHAIEAQLSTIEKINQRIGEKATSFKIDVDMFSSPEQISTKIIKNLRLSRHECFCQNYYKDR